MKGQYKFVQTVHTGPQASVPVKVKHDHAGAVPMTEKHRVGAYLRQIQAPVYPGSVAEFAYLTDRQLRQVRRSRRRALVRAAKALDRVA